jgi:hypothetical protein
LFDIRGDSQLSRTTDGEPTQFFFDAKSCVTRFEVIFGEIAKFFVDDFDGFICEKHFENYLDVLGDPFVMDLRGP